MMNKDDIQSSTSFEASNSTNNNVENIIHNDPPSKRRKIVEVEQQRKWCKKCVSTEPKKEYARVISKWYPDVCISDEEVVATCPVCCYDCVSQPLLPGCSPKDIKGYSCSEHDKLKYSKHILQKVLPLVKSLNNEQLMEKEIEAKLKGISISELELEVTECDVDEDIFCDKCGTYIFDLYRRCVCGYELCLSCCRDLRDKVMTNGWKVCIDGRISCPSKDVGGCDDGILELKHVMPVDWVVNAVKKAQGNYDDIPQTSVKSCKCNEKGDDASSLYTLSSKLIEPEDMQHFQMHWSKGEPVIANDVLSASSRLNWEPMVLWRAFHHIKRSSDHTHSHAYELKVIKTSDWSEVPIDLYKFFNGYFKECDLLFKLEDWQPSCVSEDEWPHHFVEFVKCLPFKDYTHPHDGYLNVLNKLPDLALRPNMGPKINIAYKDSVTLIRCDKSDTVNVLAHTLSKKRNLDGQCFDDEIEEGALWDIFRRQDRPILEEYIRMHPAKPIVHPIHDRNFYLDDKHKRKLQQEFGIKPWTVKQKVGDAIYIPAGCAYQVLNLKSNTNVELNFVSPESLEECFHLQQEFRMLPANHRAKQEMLNIEKIISYALDHAVEDLAKVIHSNEISNVDNADISDHDHSGWVYEPDIDEESDTPMPEEKTSETSLEVDIQMPEEKTSEIPPEVDTPMPEEKTSEIPPEVDTPMPEEKTLETPLEVDIPMPEEKTSEIPPEVDTLMPEDKTSETSLEVDIQMPEETTLETPPEVDIQMPEETTSETLLEVDMPRPVEKTSESPLEVDIPRSEDKTSESPLEVDIARSEDKTSESPLEVDTPMPEYKTSETPLEVVGLWKDHEVGKEAKQILKYVECHYPTTFQGVFFRSEEFFVVILKEFSEFIKRLRGITADTVSLDQITTLRNEVDDFEKAGFDLSWVHQRLNMTTEQSLEQLKARLVEKTVILAEAAKMLEKAELDYDNAVDKRNRKAVEMVNKFGADYDSLLKGQLGLGLLPGYKIV